MRIVRTRLNSQEINSKNLSESLILAIEDLISNIFYTSAYKSQQFL